jgi:hypothetical protein
MEKMAEIEAAGNLPKADVYAGDTRAADLSTEPGLDVFLFAIEADAEADVLGRVANLINLANRVPRSVTLQRQSLERVHILIEMEQISAGIADMIRRKLIQLTCIISVDLTIQNVA